MIVSSVFISGHFCYMFFCNYWGQKVIDHSSDVCHKMCVTYISNLIDYISMILEILLLSKAVRFGYTYKNIKCK